MLCFQFARRETSDRRENGVRDEEILQFARGNDRISESVVHDLRPDSNEIPKRPIERRKGVESCSERKASTATSRAAGSVMAAPVMFIPAADFVRLRDPSVAVVDVRDEERKYDGHIAGSLYYPSETFEQEIPDLLKDLRGRDTVVFHCAKSQIRGPTCARTLVEHLNKASSARTADKRPKVLVLERGFDGWAAAGRPVCSCKDVPCNHI